MSYLCPNCESVLRKKRNDTDYLHCGFCDEDWLRPEPYVTEEVKN